MEDKLLQLPALEIAFITAITTKLTAINSHTLSRLKLSSNLEVDSEENEDVT